MRKIRDVLRLSFGEGLSRRQVAASLQLPRATVADYVKRAGNAGVGWPLPEDLDDQALEVLLFANTSASSSSSARPLPEWQKVHLELRRPHMTLMLLWHEYKETFPDGYAYSQFTELYRRWHRHLDVVMRQEHKAGEKLFVDFPGSRIPIYDEKTGDVSFAAELFVAALGASSYLYAEAVRSQQLMYWISAHVHALEFYGGSPAIVVCDNLRSGVTRPHRYEPDVNATYQEMAAFYQMAIVPARSYKPRDKAKAEAGVLLSERWIIARLRHERFSSLAEANVAIGELVKWINARSFKKIDESRRSLFEAVDRPALKALPEQRYEFATWHNAKVNIDYHIELRADRHYYSVPYRLVDEVMAQRAADRVGETVEVRVSARTVEVFHRHLRVASHVRSYTPGFTTDPAHMPESHRRHAQWTPSRVISWAKATGANTAQLTEEIMATRPHPEQGFRSCLGIMRLADRYGKQRVEAACGRALAVRSLQLPVSGVHLVQRA
jgi:transposase